MKMYLDKYQQYADTWLRDMNFSHALEAELLNNQRGNKNPTVNLKISSHFHNRRIEYELQSCL